MVSHGFKVVRNGFRPSTVCLTSRPRRPPRFHVARRVFTSAPRLRGVGVAAPGAVVQRQAPEAVRGAGVQAPRQKRPADLRAPALGEKRGGGSGWGGWVGGWRGWLGGGGGLTSIGGLEGGGKQIHERTCQSRGGWGKEKGARQTKPLGLVGWRFRAGGGGMKSMRGGKKTGEAPH